MSRNLNHRLTFNPSRGLNLVFVLHLQGSCQWIKKVAQLTLDGSSAFYFTNAIFMLRDIDMTHRRNPQYHFVDFFFLVLKTIPKALLQEHISSTLKTNHSRAPPVLYGNSYYKVCKSILSHFRSFFYLCPPSVLLLFPMQDSKLISPGRLALALISICKALCLKHPFCFG